MNEREKIRLDKLRKMLKANIDYRNEDNCYVITYRKGNTQYECCNRDIDNLVIDAMERIGGDIVNNTFGANLKKIRTREHILQSRLAKILGVTQATISSWEIGRTEPSINDLFLMSYYLDVSIDYLIKGEE